MTHSTDLMRKIFDAIPSMIFVVDDDVKVYEYNKAAADFLSMEQSAILKHRGGEILKCVHSTEAPGGCGLAPFCEGCVIRNSVKTAAAGGRIERTRTRLQVVRGEDVIEIYALITASPFSYDDNDIILLVIEDISEIAELQRMIPICSICRKVRDEKEAWSQIEGYFKKHWDINFSHGLCPDCYQKEINKLESLAKTEQQKKQKDS